MPPITTGPLTLDPEQCPPLDDLLRLAAVGFRHQSDGDVRYDGRCWLYRLCPQCPDGERSEELLYVPASEDEGQDAYWRLRIFHQTDDDTSALVLTDTLTSVLDILTVLCSFPYHEVRQGAAAHHADPDTF